MFHFLYSNLVIILQIQYTTTIIIKLYQENWYLQIETVWYQYDYWKFTLTFEVNHALERVYPVTLRKHR